MNGRYNYTVEHSENPDFEPFAKAMMSERRGEEINGIVEQRVREADEFKGSDGSDEKDPEE